MTESRVELEGNLNVRALRRITGIRFGPQSARWESESLAPVTDRDCQSVTSRLRPAGAGATSPSQSDAGAASSSVRGSVTRSPAGQAASASEPASGSVSRVRRRRAPSHGPVTVPAGCPTGGLRRRRLKRQKTVIMYGMRATLPPSPGLRLILPRSAACAPTKAALAGAGRRGLRSRGNSSAWAAAESSEIIRNDDS